MSLWIYWNETSQKWGLFKIHHHVIDFKRRELGCLVMTATKYGIWIWKMRTPQPIEEWFVHLIQFLWTPNTLFTFTFSNYTEGVGTKLVLYFKFRISVSILIYLKLLHEKLYIFHDKWNTVNKTRLWYDHVIRSNLS